MTAKGRHLLLDHCDEWNVSGPGTHHLALPPACGVAVRATTFSFGPHQGDGYWQLGLRYAIRHPRVVPMVQLTRLDERTGAPPELSDSWEHVLTVYPLLDGASIEAFGRESNAQHGTVDEDVVWTIADALLSVLEDNAHHPKITGPVTITTGGEVWLDPWPDVPASPRVAVDFAANVRLAWLTPEQIQNERTAKEDPGWFFAVRLCELVTGVHPFAPKDAPSMVELVRGIVQEPPAVDRLPATWSTLAPLIERCLNKDPDRRPSLPEVRAEFDDARRDTPYADDVPAERVADAVERACPEVLRAQRERREDVYGRHCGHARERYPRPVRTIGLPGLYVQVEMSTDSYIYLDRSPVTNEDYGEFVAQQAKAPPAHWPNGKLPSELRREPVVNVCPEDAAAYAKWRGGRLPSTPELTAAVQGDAPLLSSGGQWEWTSSVRPETELPAICGGAWRDRDEGPHRLNRSHEVEAAPDVTFRCAYRSMDDISPGRRDEPQDPST